MTYLEKAKKLNESGFWVAGFGNFDITLEELALILKYLDNNDFESISSLYKKLERERL